MCAYVHVCIYIHVYIIYKNATLYYCTTLNLDNLKELNQFANFSCTLANSQNFKNFRLSTVIQKIQDTWFDCCWLKCIIRFLRSIACLHITVADDNDSPKQKKHRPHRAQGPSLSDCTLQTQSTTKIRTLLKKKSNKLLRKGMMKKQHIKNQKTCDTVGVLMSLVCSNVSCQKYLFGYLQTSTTEPGDQSVHQLMLQLRHLIAVKDLKTTTRHFYTLHKHKYKTNLHRTP